MKTKLTFKQSISSGLIAAITAVSVNVLLYLLLRAAGIFTDVVEIRPGQALTAVPVVISSIFPSIIGSLVFFLLEKFTSNGFKLFTIVTVVLTLLSFMNPFMMIPNVPVSFGIGLNVMHIVVAGSLLFYLNKSQHKSTGEPSLN